MPEDNPRWHSYQDADLWPGKEQDAIRGPRYGPQDAEPGRVCGQAQSRPPRSQVSPKLSPKVVKVSDVMALVGVVVAGLLLAFALSWVMATLPGVHGALR